MPTNQTWLDLGLADPPTIDGFTAPSKPTPTTPIVVYGHGDAGDTIKVYSDGGYVGTGTVGADGTWSVTIFLPVGYSHDLTATQTVNELPQVGLTSDLSCHVDITVYPNPPAITFTSIPGPATSTTPVTVSGTGDAGDTVTLYDGSHSIASVTITAAGTWTLSVNLAAGTHTLTATQTTQGGNWNQPPKLTSDSSASATVIVYAPPPAPSISVPVGSLVPLTITGTGVAGDTVTVYEGSTVVGTALVAANGILVADRWPTRRSSSTRTSRSRPTRSRPSPATRARPSASPSTRSLSRRRSRRSRRRRRRRRRPPSRSRAPASPATRSRSTTARR